MDAPRPHEEVFRLIELAATGQADQSNFDRLAWLLEHDERARETYARSWMLDVDLRQAFHPNPSQGEEANLCPLVMPQVDDAPTVAYRRRLPLYSAALLLSAAALVLVAVGLAGFQIGHSSGVETAQQLREADSPGTNNATLGGGAQLPIPSSDLRVHLTKASRCIWGNAFGESDSFRQGGVERGESLELLEGFATFSIAAADWRAAVQIEGPAAMVVTSQELPALRHGKMLVQINRSRKPLSIDLPYAKVHLMPDSEVGVVAFGGMCEVHVFHGLASLKSLWNADSASHVQTDGAYVVAEGSSVAMEAENGAVVSTKPGNANRGMFDVSEFMAGGQLVITKSYVDQVVSAAPIAYWRFEELRNGLIGNVMSDRYALQTHGKVGIDGLTGNRHLSFPLDSDANDQRFLYTSEPITTAMPEDYSVEMWVNPSHFHTATVLTLLVPEMARRESTTTWKPRRESQHGLLLEIGGFSGERAIMQPHKLRYLHRNPPSYTGGQSIYSDVVYTIREWQHVACVKEGDVMRAYLNGKLCSSGTDVTNLPTDLVAVIGQISDTRFERPFYGQIDEFAVYDRALTEDEINAHYSAADFIGRPGTTKQLGSEL